MARFQPGDGDYTTLISVVDPKRNLQLDAGGRLPNDRPHMLRVIGSVDVPRTGLVVAANVQHFMGKPWATTPPREGIATDNLFSPNFAQPTAFSDPRRAMVGARLNLGR